MRSVLGWANDWVSVPSSVCHTHRRLSELAAASRSPSPLNATSLTHDAAPASSGPATGVAGAETSHRWTRESVEPAATVVPSGLRSNDVTLPPDPVNGAVRTTGRAGSVTSHTAMRPSTPPAASTVPDASRARA